MKKGTLIIKELLGNLVLHGSGRASSTRSSCTEVFATCQKQPDLLHALKRNIGDVVQDLKRNAEMESCLLQRSKNSLRILTEHIPGCGDVRACHALNVLSDVCLRHLYKTDP